MNDYISRKALLDWVHEFYPEDKVFASAIINAPAADVAPVVHGRWEYTPQTFNTLGLIRCPFCKWWSFDKSIDGIYKYCPSCGAKMDGGNVV